MHESSQSLHLLLRSLQPRLHDGVYVFASIAADADIASLSPIGTFRETEGLTVIVEESMALRGQLKVLFRAAWIELAVHSELAAVGLTAAISTALASENIPCNVVAAVHHDHLFVPVELGPRAMEVLLRLQRQAVAKSIR